METRFYLFELSWTNPDDINTYKCWQTIRNDIPFVLTDNWIKANPNIKLGYLDSLYCRHNSPEYNGEWEIIPESK